MAAMNKNEKSLFQIDVLTIKNKPKPNKTKKLKIKAKIKKTYFEVRL